MCHESAHESAHECAQEGAHTRSLSLLVALQGRPTQGPTKRATKVSAEVSMKVSTQVVRFHMSAVHMFCFLPKECLESRCLPPVFHVTYIFLEIWRREHGKRGICIKLSEIDFQIRDTFATILRTLSLMYETKYRQFWHAICATLPSRTPPSRDF